MCFNRSKKHWKASWERAMDAVHRLEADNRKLRDALATETRERHEIEGELAELQDTLADAPVVEFHAVSRGEGLQARAFVGDLVVTVRDTSKPLTADTVKQAVFSLDRMNAVFVQEK